MTPPLLHIVDELPHVVHIDSLRTLYDDRRPITLNAAQAATLEWAAAELRERGFRLYPAVLDGIVREFNGAPAGAAAELSASEEHLADQVEREGAWEWPTTRAQARASFHAPDPDVSA